jgi:hypothetical protein
LIRTNRSLRNGEWRANVKSATPSGGNVMNLGNLSRKQKVLGGLGAVMLVGLVGSAFDSDSKPKTTTAIEQPQAQASVEPKATDLPEGQAKPAGAEAKAAKEAVRAAEDKAAEEAEDKAAKARAEAAEAEAARAAEAIIAAKAEAAKPTTAQSNAVRSAENYLDFAAFSRSGLIKQLKFEGFSTGDATYAVDNIDVSWKKEAAESAKSYLEMSSFSRSGLLKQLAFEGYTPAQATYGVNQTGL